MRAKTNQASRPNIKKVIHAFPAEVTQLLATTAVNRLTIHLVREGEISWGFFTKARHKRGKERTCHSNLRPIPYPQLRPNMLAINSPSSFGTISLKRFLDSGSHRACRVYILRALKNHVNPS